MHHIVIPEIEIPINHAALANKMAHGLSYNENIAVAAFS